MMNIMKGDAYEIAITLKDEDENAITPADVLDVEITLGKLSKRLTEDEVHYDDGKWIFPMTQEETFALSPVAGLQARVKFLTGDVVGGRIGNIYVRPSNSAEVL